MTVGEKKIHPLICVSVLLQNKIKDTRTHIKLAAGQSAETTLRWLMITYRHRVGEHLSHVLGHCNGTCGLYFGGQVPQHGGLRLLICRWAAEESALSSSPSHCQTQTLNRHFVWFFFIIFFITFSEWGVQSFTHTDHSKDHNIAHYGVNMSPQIVYKWLTGIYNSESKIKMW